MRRDWWKLLALLVPVLTGCLSHTHKLQQPKLAGVVMNADAIELVEAINKRYDEINSLTATVDFAASVGGTHTGKQTDYTSFHGFILFRKPMMLRVIGEVPVIRTIAFNLASNGDTFTLLIPHYSKAIQGSSSVTTRAANPIENLRPSTFLDSIVIQRVTPDRIVSLINSSSTTVEPRTKQLIETPQYDLTILKAGNPSSPSGLPQVDKPLRVIHFSRINLMPTEQDIYDANGSVETQVIYGPYQDFNGTQYPASITINRLLDEYRITLTVEKLVLNPTNPPLTDKSFELEIPKGYKVQKMP
jgi:outer membrane lipoprotein-sorting protein